MTDTIARVISRPIDEMNSDPRFQVIKYRDCDGRQIKMIWCISGEFVDEKTTQIRRGFTPKNWKTWQGAKRWLAERPEMEKYATVQRV